MNRLHLANDEALPDGDFTVEATVLLRSLDEDAAVRTIAAQWDGDTLHPGWSFGVTGEKSSFGPRNLVLQMVSDPVRGGAGHEVVVSNLHPELNKPYYLAATVNIRFQSPAGITFYMKDLSQADSELQTASAAHRVTGNYRGPFDFTVGGRDQSNRHFWDGLIGEVRLSTVALAPGELLISHPSEATQVVGHWRFDSPEAPLADSSGTGLDLANNDTSGNPSPRATALIDFCHVLLNANPFLYVD